MAFMVARISTLRAAEFLSVFRDERTAECNPLLAMVQMRALTSVAISGLPSFGVSLREIRSRLESSHARYASRADDRNP
nr:MAG: hypothetical protein DIU78_03840 [Pseudomonadota bacterium]